MNTAGKVGAGVGAGLATLGAIVGSVLSFGAASAPLTAGAIAADTAAAGAIGGSVAAGAGAAGAGLAGAIAGGAAADVAAGIGTGATAAGIAGGAAGAGAGAATGGAVASALPTISAGATLPESLGGLPLASSVLPAASSVPLSAGGSALSGSILPAAEATASTLPLASSMPLSAGGSAVSTLPSVLPNASSMPLSAGGSALSSNLPTAGMAGNTLPTLTYPTIGTATPGMSSTIGANAMPAQPSVIDKATQLTSKIGAQLMQPKAAPDTSAHISPPSSSGNIYNALYGNNSFMQNPNTSMAIPGIAPIGQVSISQMPAPMPLQQPMISQPMMPQLPPMMATSDWRSKVNIRSSNNELDSLLNEVYMDLKNKRKF